MKILTKRSQKDYYDYLQGVLGQDELVIYDRRESFFINPQKVYGSMPSYIAKWFSHEIVFGDKKREYKDKWNSKKVLIHEESESSNDTKQNSIKSKCKDVLEGEILHFVLEVGYYHYIFEVERYIDDNDLNKVHLKYGLVQKERVEKNERISSAPMSICPIKFRHYYWLQSENSFYLDDTCKRQAIINPILYSTYIPKFIDAKQIWNELYEYISSLRDKEFTDTRTNDQHIESHGFDKKISFRRRK